MNHQSPSEKTWKRFKQNKPAVAGLVFIALTTLMGILGYVIMPDDSPMANNMMLQLSIKKPGSTYTILKTAKNETVEQRSFFGRMFYGQPSDHSELPVSWYNIKGDTLYYREYIGDEEQADISAVPVYRLAGRTDSARLHALPAPERVKEIGEKYIEKRTYYLGTDIYGRDLLSRLILGIRVSLSVGVMAVIISLIIGVAAGSVAGYYRGKTDASISWLMNVVWSLPALLLVIAISFALGKGFWQIFIAVGLSMWVEVARLVRGQTLALKEVEFVEASRALGFTDSRTIFHHILPNIAGPILVVASSNFASAILLEAGLSFLGFGAQPPMPTWGGMIKEHYGYIIIDAAYLAILPGLAIMLMVYAFNLVAVGLRDAFDVRSQNTNV